MKQLVLSLLVVATFIYGCSKEAENIYNTNSINYKYADYMASILDKPITEEDMTIYGMNMYRSQTLFISYFMSSVGFAQTIGTSAENISLYSKKSDNKKSLLYWDKRTS